MTVADWVKAEKFYEFWFLVLTVCLCLNVIWLIFVISYESKKQLRRSVMLIVVLTLGLISTGAVKHWQYRPYLEQARYSNPLIRDRKPRLLTYVYYGQAEQVYYTQLNALENLRKMAMYEEERVIEPIIYLGKDTYYHYFARENGDLFKKIRQIEFTESVRFSQLVGSKFKLKDNTFKDIGFKNPDQIMFEVIRVPLSAKQKSYQKEDEYPIPKAEEGIQGWNF